MQFDDCGVFVRDAGAAEILDFWNRNEGRCEFKYNKNIVKPIMEQL